MEVDEITNKDDIEILTKVINELKSLDKERFMKIMKMIITYFDYKEKTSTSSENIINRDISLGRPSFSEDRSLTAKQFILDKQPVTDVERVACLAYYLTHYKNQPHFKTLDISLINTEAAQRKFASASVAVDNATTRGYLVSVGKGMKQISAAGELYVQKLPDKAAAQEVMAKVRKKKTKKNVN